MSVLVFNAKNILGFLLVTLFLSSFTSYRFKERKWPVLIPLSALTAVASLLIIFFKYEDIEFILDLITMISFSVMPYFILKKRKWYVFALFGLIVNSVLDFFVETVNYYLNIQSTINLNLIYIGFLLAGLICILIVRRIKGNLISPEIFESIPAIIWIVIFLLCLSSYYIMMLSHNREFTQLNSVGLRIVSGIFFIGCLLYMMIKFSSAVSIENRLNMQVESQIEQYKILKENNKEIREFRHDYKNNMIALAALLDSKKYEEAQRFISEMNKAVIKSNTEFYTGNYLADAIVSYKASQVKNDGITIKFDGSIPAETISNNDLSVILSNLLDNAIRGCSGCEPCSIDIVCNESPAGLMMTISNPVKENVDLSKGLKTTKKDRENHGIGINNIKKITKKYNGFISFNCTDKVFSVKIGLVFK